MTTYGHHPRTPAPRIERATPTDRRYSPRRGADLSRAVRQRGQGGFVPGCNRGGPGADHIVPVHPGMSDAEFYDPANLRGACRRHNNLRGWATTAARELREGGGFSEPRQPGEAGLANLHTQVVDYTRRGAA